MKIFGYIFATGITVIAIGMTCEAFLHSTLTGLVAGFLLGCITFMVWFWLFEVVIDFEKTEKMKKLGKFNCGAGWHDNYMEAIRCGNHKPVDEGIRGIGEENK